MGVGGLIEIPIMVVSSAKVHSSPGERIALHLRSLMTGRLSF